MASQKLVLDAFENLFQSYSNIQSLSLPKFKKKIKTRHGECAKNPSSKPTKPLLSACNDHDESSLLDRAVSHQGSLSSGVFSLDSDPDCLPAEDHPETLADKDEVIASDERLIPPSDDDTVSEAGSGITHRCGTGHSLGNGQPMVKELQDADSDSSRDDDLSHILTDEDVLFMMHKPKLKKRKKKPPWQKRKLDLNDLWLKGQHRWCPSKADDNKKMPNKLYLERNLKWGKISLQNYVCAMRKSRKGRKQPKMTERCQSKTSNATSRKKARRSTGGQRASSKRAPSMRTENNEMEKNDGQSSKLKRDKKDQGSSKFKKQPEVLSGASVFDPVIIHRRTQSSRKMRGMPRVMSTAISSIDSCSTDEAQSSADTSHGMFQRKYSRDQQQQANSELSSDSDDSVINFISLTPKKSRKKLQKRRNQQKTMRRNSLAAVQQNKFSRSKGMLIQTGSQTSDTSEWDEANYRPLFGQSRHCGGVWGSIVEESA